MSGRRPEALEPVLRPRGLAEQPVVDKLGPGGHETKPLLGRGSSDAVVDGMDRKKLRLQAADPFARARRRGPALVHPNLCAERVDRVDPRAPA